VLNATASQNHQRTLKKVEHMSMARTAGRVAKIARQLKEQTPSVKLLGLCGIWLSGGPDKADFMWFDFNRLTGEIAVEFLRKATAEELKDIPPLPKGVTGGPVMVTLTGQRGDCTKSKPAF
jgi:hypothetical protein